VREGQKGAFYVATYKRFSPTARFQHLIVTYRIAFQLTGALFVR
jgi:hypothetical protein